MKTFNNFIELTENSISTKEENDIINFTSPLSITDDSRQWNMTKYDIPSLDISHYDGLVTVNHGQDIADVVGKVINLRKDEQGHKVLIDGIKFAVNSNPVAILAKNLMKDGFVTGVSIETLGGEADQTGTWLGHKLCGLSIVAHPNNLNAYATIGNYRQAVANSIQEAQKNGLDTSKIENAAKDLEDTKSIYFFDNKNYNNNMETAKETVKRNSNRLSSLLDKIENGGPGSGNHAPGQGRGVGKPGAGAGGSAPSGTSRKLRVHEVSHEADLGYYVEDGDRILASGKTEKEALAKAKEKLSKMQELTEIRDRDRQKQETEASKAKIEREEHIKQIDKIIGSEKISEGKTKAEDDKNYKKLEKDVREIKKILAKEKSRENFGQDEIRKLKDKYSDYMSGNWSTVERFKRLVDDLEDWADNYQNY